MNKIIIFNVWWALSSYIEIWWWKAIIDLWKNWDFSPIHDFLLPLFKIKKYTKENEKFYIDQLFLSHLDSDHISDYLEFKKFFYPKYLTCPNSHNKQDEVLNVNKQLLWEENEIRNIILKDMTSEWKRQPPLWISDAFQQNAKMFFIPPKKCEKIKELNMHYANNISLSIFIRYNNYTIYFPWDIQKEWMEYLILNNNWYKSFLNNNKINFLIAPHHWLSTSFPQIFFNVIKWNKTDLNIISEKTRSSDNNENRSDVDKRYYDSTYSTWQNQLKQNWIKTSLWHIIIDLETWNIAQYKDSNDALRNFIWYNK